jgi:hypothetical protein
MVVEGALPFPLMTRMRALKQLRGVSSSRLNMLLSPDARPTGLGVDGMQARQPRSLGDGEVERVEC